MTISKKDSDTVRTNHDRFCYMRDNGHLKYLDKANLCDDYFEGKQWDTVLERRLQSQGKPVSDSVAVILKSSSSNSTTYSRQH